MAEFDPDAYLDGKKKKSTGFDPDEYLKKTAPESALQTFGRGSASLADSALNALTGTLDAGAYALARAAGRSPEQATAETTSPKDVVGRAFGVAGTPGYETAPVRQVGTAIGEGLQSSVFQPIAQTTGLPEADVANMFGTATMAAGPAIPKVAGAAGRVAAPVVRGAADTVIGLGKVAMSPIETAKGIGGGLFNTAKAPGAAAAPWETASARMPIGETYIPANILEQYRAGQITAEQAQAGAVPTSTLPQAALRKTEGMVPYAGQEMRAAGEQIGAAYRDPYKAAAEIGADYLLGGVPTVLRAGSKLYDIGSKARAYGQLGEAGFTPLTAAEAAALRGGAAGPVAPSSIPAPIRAEAAARITPVAPQPVAQPQPQPITPIAQKAQQVMGNKYRAPKVEEPTAGPVAPETTFPTAEEFAQQQMMNKLSGEAAPTGTYPIGEQIATVAPGELSAGTILPETLQKYLIAAGRVPETTTTLTPMPVAIAETPKVTFTPPKKGEVLPTRKGEQAVQDAVAAGVDAEIKYKSGKDTITTTVYATPKTMKTNPEFKITRSDISSGAADPTVYGTHADGTPFKGLVKEDKSITYYNITNPKKPTVMADFDKNGKRK